MLWKWLTYDVDMHKRRNKVLTVIATWGMATVAWIYIIPVLNPSGAWKCTNRQSTDYVIIHENTLKQGYTVIVLTQGKDELNVNTKDNIITAWFWRFNTFTGYSIIEPQALDNALK